MVPGINPKATISDALFAITEWWSSGSCSLACEAVEGPRVVEDPWVVEGLGVVEGSEVVEVWIYKVLFDLSNSLWVALFEGMTSKSRTKIQHKSNDRKMQIWL